LLKLQFKTLSDLLRYLNLVMWQPCRVSVCESYGVQLNTVRLTHNTRHAGTN